MLQDWQANAVFALPVETDFARWLCRTGAGIAHGYRKRGVHEMEQQRIFIFLDIDGVLNTSSQWKRMYQLDDECIARFSAYARTLAAPSRIRIVLTSSWKNGFDPAGRHSPQVQELLGKLAANGLSVIGKTESMESEDRAEEINEYIRKHALENNECIVIDDDPDIFRSKLADNCTMLLTDARTGFKTPPPLTDNTPCIAERILRFLGCKAFT